MRIILFCFIDQLQPKIFQIAQRYILVLSIPHKTTTDPTKISPER
jgi:hypothetical protein